MTVFESPILINIYSISALFSLTVVSIEKTYQTRNIVFDHANSQTPRGLSKVFHYTS